MSLNKLLKRLMADIQNIKVHFLNELKPKSRKKVEETQLLTPNKKNPIFHLHPCKTFRKNKKKYKFTQYAPWNPIHAINHSAHATEEQNRGTPPGNNKQKNT